VSINDRILVYVGFNLQDSDSIWSLVSIIEEKVTIFLVLANRKQYGKVLTNTF